MSSESMKLLTRRDVERLYGVSKRYLELAPSRDQGPPIVRIGRSVRYREGDVVAWIESRLERRGD